MIKIFAITALAGSVLISVIALAQEGTSSTSASEKSREGGVGGLYVEPIISGESANASIKTSAIPFMSDTSGSVRGVGLGLKLGGHIGHAVFLGADGRYSRTAFEDSTYERATATGANYGLTLGGQTPYFGIRIFGSYILGGYFDPEPGAHGVDARFDQARGYRVGAGLHLAVVAINLEYQDIAYDRSSIQSGGDLGPSTGQSEKIDLLQKGTVLSLSFPIQL